LGGVKDDEYGSDDDGENECQACHGGAADKDKSGNERQDLADKIEVKARLFQLTHHYCAIDTKNEGNDAKDQDRDTVIVGARSYADWVGSLQVACPRRSVGHLILVSNGHVIHLLCVERVIDLGKRTKAAADEGEDGQDIEHVRELFGFFQDGFLGGDVGAGHGVGF
jgi:hypothetical protein